MKKFSTLLASIALAVIFASPAFATTSSINPTQPAQNAPLLSATIRALALAAYNDITAIFGDLTVSANQFLGSTAGGQAVGITIPNCPNGVGYVSGGGFVCASGTGITALTGDVVATGPGSAGAALQNTSTARTNVGLGLASTPQFAGLTLTGVENINLNTGSLIAALTGTTLHQANVDGAINRHQLDAFGNSAHFSALRADGTAAAPTALQSADVIGSFNGWGYDGTSYGAGASWQIATSQIWTPSAHGSVASIWTTPNGTTTPVQQVIVGNDGGVTLGIPTGGDKGANTFNAAGTIWSNGVQLQNGALVAGTNITITGSWPNQTINATTTGGGGGAVTLGSLTTANPSISGDLTSGFYTAGAGLVDVGISGSKIVEWASTGSSTTGTSTISSASANSLAVGPNGTTNPAFSVNSSTASGVAGLQVVNAASGGTVFLNTVGGTNAGLSINAEGTGTLTLAGGGSAGASVAIRTIGQTAATFNNNTLLLTPSIASVAPHITFTNAADTGLIASTEIPIIKYDFAAGSRQHATGALTLERDFLITGVTHSFVGASTATDLATFGYNLPGCGTNATCTNVSGLYHASTALTGTPTNSFVINVAADTGGTNNYAARLNGNVQIGTTLTFSATAPTVSSGFGTSPSIVAGNATAFTLNVGTGGSATSGIVGLPTATTGWICDARDITSASTLVTAMTAQTASSATFGSFSRTTGTSTAWGASDVLGITCVAF